MSQAKGLEFDSVLIGDPAGILAESPRGLSDLYVALTRATQRLGVVHSGELPEVLPSCSRSATLCGEWMYQTAAQNKPSGTSMAKSGAESAGSASPGAMDPSAANGRARTKIRRGPLHV